MRKEYIFLFIVIFCILGAFYMLFSLNLLAAFFYFILTAIFSYINRFFVIELITGKISKKKNETQEEYEIRLNKREEQKANEKKQREQRRLERLKWESVLWKECEINRENKLIKLNGKIYSFDSIIGCNLIENEDIEVITKTTGTNKKKVSLGKTALGGAFFGLAGAIVGGERPEKLI